MRSMTAYAAAEEKTKQGKVKIILRSLNFKYLDISFYNLPQQAFVLEEKMRDAIKKVVTRGKIEVYFYQGGGQAGQFFINKKEFGNYVKQMKKLAGDFSLDSQIPVLGILNLPGVVCASRNKNFSKTRVLLVLKEALAKLVIFKEEKGRAIEREMLKNLGNIDKNIERIIKDKKVAKGEEELKEDIDEEVALIKFYSKKLKQAIALKKQLRKGKEIDFLSQEVLRELNASASKTRKEGIASLIVEAKNYLGRIREQAQNIE